VPCRPSASLFMLLVRQRMADEQRTTLILREKNEFFAEKNHFPRRKNHFPRLVHRSSAILCRTRSTNRDALGLQGTTSPQTSVHDCSHGHLLERVQPEPEFVGPSLGAHSYGAFTAPRHARRRKCLDKPHSHALRAPWWQDMSGNAMNAEKIVRPARSLAVRMTNERRRQVARATRHIRGEPPILRSRRIGNQHHSHGTRPQTSVDHPSSPRLLFRPRREQWI